jgi:chromosome segregation protein
MSYSIAQDIEKADEEKKGYDTQVDALQIELKMLDTRKMEAKKDLDTVQGGLQTISERLQENKVAYASKEERLKGLKGLLGMRYQEIESDAIRIQELKEKEGELIASLGEMEQALISAQEEIKRQEVRYGAYLPQFKDHTLKAETIRKNMDELNNALTSLEKQKQDLMLSDKEQEIAYKMMLERYTARFGSGLPQVPEDFDPEKARAEIAQYQTRIEVMGQINFAAIESYEEAQTRFDELHKQYEDIVLASTRLRELIANIERESAKEFMATFAKVRANFQEIFTAMFGGGQADIVLQQGGGIDAGVEIFACPPFKRLKAMSLLSEGEKTLCAISFTFALFKVRPSPFCILDEVDAPLDDANLERFNRLIKAFSKDSQFLVVTHNKNTLEVADIIYGITFDVPGVTKVVSMDLQREKG